MKKATYIIAIVLAVLAAAVFLTVDIYRRSARDMVTLYQSQQFWIARQLVRDLDDYIKGCELDLMELPSTPSVRNLDKEQIKSELSGRLQELNYVDSISLYDDGGRVIVSTDEAEVGHAILDPSLLARVARPENRGKVTLIASRKDREESTGGVLFEFQILTPIYGGKTNPDSTEKFSGALSYSIDLETLLLQQPVLVGEEDKRLWLMDQTGTLLFHSEHPEMVLRSVAQTEGACQKCHTSMDYAYTMLREKQGTVDYSIRGFPKKLAAYASFELGDVHWIVVVTSPYDMVTALARRNLSESIVLLCVTAFAFVGGAALVYRNHRMKLKAEEEARLLRERRPLEDRIQLLAAQLLTVQEDERKRLSRELHDDINQSLAVLAMDLELLEIERAPRPEEVFSKLHSFRDRIAELTDRVHDLAYELHPSILDDLGLVAALKSYLDSFAAREGIDVTFTRSNIPESLDPEVSTCLYRVAQESLRNVAKHAKANHASVTLGATPEAIVLEVEDSGVGFVPESLGQAAGLGLVSCDVRPGKGDADIGSRP
jgi:signal transduction histidine kinase